MKKIFYYTATVVLLFSSSTLVSAKENTGFVEPPVKQASVTTVSTLPDTCDQLFNYSLEKGLPTVKSNCGLQVNAAQMNLAFFNTSDAVINKMFNDDKSIMIKDQHEADIIVTHQFFLENEPSIVSR